MNRDRNILMVEDNEDDIILIQRALKKGGISAPVFIAKDGDAAVEYLAVYETMSGNQIQPPPTIVLLDLKLPRRSGFEVLEWIRLHPVLNTLPVVIFTTSTLASDLARAYELGANSYLKKPSTMAETTELLKTVSTYWLTQNELPPLLQRN